MIKFLQNKKTVLCLGLTVLFSLVNLISYTYTNQPPTSYTNAPSESNCTSCHGGSGLVTSGNSWSSITLTANGGNLEYVPDSTCHMVLTADISGISKYGFQIVALDSSTNKSIGTFTITNSTRTAKATASVAGNTREYVLQKSAGTSPQNNNEITWSFDWKAPSTRPKAIKFYAVVNATNSNNNDNGDVIYAKVFTMRLSTSLPTITAAVSSKSVCKNDTLFCQGSGNNIVSYQWNIYSGANSIASDTGASPYFIMKNPGTYKVKVKASNTIGVAFDSQTVTVKAKPTVSITANGNTAICSGDSLQLTATATGGSSLSWNTNDTTNAIYVKTANSFQVTATLNGCFDTSNTIVTTINSKPTISIAAGGNTNLCSTDSLQLSASASAGSTLSWNNNKTDSIIYVNTSGTYQATATLNGCSETSNSINVNVSQKLAAPTLNCGNTTLNSVTYTWQSLSGASGYEVSEDGGANWIQPSSGANGTSHARSGLNQNTNYTIWIRAIDNSPCQYSEIDSITCNTTNCNAITYSVAFDSLVCAGVDDTIDFNITSTSNYAILFNGSYSNKNQFIVNANNDSTYLFEILDSNQLACPTQKVSITIKRSNVSNVSVALKGNGACEGIAQTFEASSGYSNYIFKDKQGNTLQNSSANSYATNNKNIITNGVDVLVANNLGCSSSFAAAGGTVFTTPLASFTYNYVSALSYSFNTNSAANIKSTWDFGDGTIDSTNQKTITHTYAAIGTYNVTLKESNSTCTDDSSMQIKAGGLGLKNEISSHIISVYPNPMNNQLTIDMSSLDESPMSIEIVELNGKVHLAMDASKLSKNSLIQLNTDQLSSGMYIIKINTSNEGVYYQKILKN